MLKRGQITVFIIVGIILLFVTAGLIFLVENVSKQELKTEEAEMAEGFSADSIKMFTDHCLERTANEAMAFVSLQGGYYKVPEPAQDQIFVKVPFYFYFGQKHFPSKRTIEEQIEMFILDKIPACLNNFTVFKKQGINIEEGQKEINVNLSKNALFELTLPLTISIGKSVIELNQFNYILNLNFEEIYSILNETVAEHEENPNYTPIGYLSTSAHENNFNFEMNYQEDDVVVYSFIFNQYQVNKEDYVFIFASKYDWSELSPKKELDYAQEVEDQSCYVGDRCYYNLNIYNNDFTFEDFTSLFDISPNGRIEFIPERKDIGNHSISVRMRDPNGNEQYISFELEILTLNNPLELAEIEDQIAYVNKTFTYKVEVTDPDGDNITFFDDTELFDISQNGLINFTAKNESVGFHIIEIIAYDGELGDGGWMYLTIER